MHRQSILDPYTGLSTWKSHQQISKGEKSRLVNSRAWIQHWRLFQGAPSWESGALLHRAQSKQDSPRHRKIPQKPAPAKLPGGLLGSAAAWSFSEFRDQNKPPVSASHSSVLVVSVTPSTRESHFSSLVLVSEF